MAKIGINGFGRGGKLLLRTILERHPTQLVACAINDPGLDSAKYGAYVFKHDSVHGRFYGEVCADDRHIIVNGSKILVFKEADCAKVPWAQAGVEWVAECSGRHTSMATAQPLIAGPVKRVAICAQSPDAPTFILGVNHAHYQPAQRVFSLGSPTLNALAPLAKVVHEQFGIRAGFLTAVRPMAAFQTPLDGLMGAAPRMGRSSLLNVIPAPSHVSQSLARVLPELRDKIAAVTLRVPLADISLLDFTVKVCRVAKLEDVTEAVKDAASCSLSGILCHTDEPAVSTDFIGCSCSLVYDSGASMRLSGQFFKLLSWYDNEYGYACRAADFLAFAHAKEAPANC